MNNLPEKHDNDKVTKDLAEKLDTLTERDWLFLSYIRKNVPIQEAYKLAGFKGKSKSAPYVLHHKLRDKCELLTDLEDFNRLRYKNELLKLVSLPLAEHKKDVTLSEKLRILKLMKSSLPGMDEAPKTQFTQLVINRYGTEEANPAIKRGSNSVIDAEVID